MSRYGAVTRTLPATLGKVFFVVNGADAWAGDMAHEFPVDRDGQPRVYATTSGATTADVTIQAALDACTANRDDYVIVLPSTNDYDLTATLTMDKARTHLICQAGQGWKGIPGNNVRLHQNTAATAYVTLSADNVEVAGFFFKQDSTSRGNIVVLSGTRWCSHIHDNFFAMSATASTSNYGIYGSGACNHYAIHDNYFTNYSPGLNTGTNNDIAAFIGLTSGSSTRGIIKNNYFVTGVNTTVAAAILDAGTGTIIEGNMLWESAANGGNDAGILTLGISSGVDSMVVNNRIGITTGNAANGVSGGTANQSYITNYEGTSGGTLLT